MAISNTGLSRNGSIHERELALNGVKVAKFTANTNALGTYVVGNKLYDNGSVVAVSSQQNPSLHLGDSLKFGEVDMVTEGKVINILLDDYNTLYNHGLVTGHKYFDPWDVYRVFKTSQALANATEVTYVRNHAQGKLTFTDGNKTVEFPEYPYLLYNNVVGELSHNTEDAENTVTEINSPEVGVRYFNPRVNVGDTIKVPICVDNYEAEYIQGITVNGVWHQAVTGPYTIELTIGGDSDRMVKKTIYSGESIIETPAFTNADVGETYITIRCIDSNGVGSAEHHLDVMVEDPNYQENLWTVSDNDLQGFGIVTNDSTIPSYPSDSDSAARTSYDAFMVQCYKNKKGLSELFSYAVEHGYNAVKLPTHRYCINAYKNKSDDPNTVTLNNDKPTYMICDIEATIVDGKVTDNVVTALSNTITKNGQEVTITEDDIVTDYDQNYRYQWFNDNYDDIRAAIVAENTAIYNAEIAKGKTDAAARSTANSSAPIPPERVGTGDQYSFVDGAGVDHSSEIIFFNNIDYSYVNTIPSYIRHAIRYFNRSFVTYSSKKSSGENIVVGSTGIKTRDGVLLNTGRYYMVTQGNATAGEPLVFPSGLTIYLNGSTLYTVNQYDFITANSICFSATTDTHIVGSGYIQCGLSTFDFARAVSRTARQDPMEHDTPIVLYGARFCSMENVTIDGAVGFTIESNLDLPEYYNGIKNGFTPYGWTPGNEGYGMYDNKRLSMVDGTIQSPYSGLETFVLSDTSKKYNNEGNTADNAIGYIRIPQQGENKYRSDAKYIYVGYGTNDVSTKGLRREIFVFFYDGSGNLLSTVKTRTSWMVRIPDDAVNVRVMGYGHSGKGAVSDSANWRLMGVHQNRNASCMEYRNCTIQNVRSAIVGGCERQVLYDTILFKNVADRNAINPDKYGCWSWITNACVDVESGAPMGKYITFNNVVATLDDGADGTTKFIIQGSENMQMTGCNIHFRDWGLLSGLIRNNTFALNYNGIYYNYAMEFIQRSTTMYHRPVQYDMNTIVPVGDYALPVYLQIRQFSQSEQVYDDTRETKVPFRLCSFDKKCSVSEPVLSNMKFRNCKNGNEYID